MKTLPLKVQGVPLEVFPKICFMKNKNRILSYEVDCIQTNAYIMFIVKNKFYLVVTRQRIKVTISVIKDNY